MSLSLSASQFPPSSLEGSSTHLATRQVAHCRSAALCTFEVPSHLRPDATAIFLGGRGTVNLNCSEESHFSKCMNAFLTKIARQPFRRHLAFLGGRGQPKGSTLSLSISPQTEAVLPSADQESASRVSCPGPQRFAASSPTPETGASPSGLHVTSRHRWPPSPRTASL